MLYLLAFASLLPPHMAAVEAALQLASGQRTPKQPRNDKGKGKGQDGKCSEETASASLLRDTLCLTL